MTSHRATVLAIADEAAKLVVLMLTVPFVTVALMGLRELLR